MPNSFQLTKNYVPLLDEVYKMASVTANISMPTSQLREGANAKEIAYAVMDMDGLSDYDRENGYEKGTASIKWKTVEFDYDRGKLFSIDQMDNVETMNLAFARLSSEFMRTKVAPEADAEFFAKVAGKTGIQSATGTIASADNFLSALLDCTNKMDEEEVPTDSRILYATASMLNPILLLDTTKSREILGRFSSIRPVPQNRFYTAIDLKSNGADSIGGYAKATSGLDLNFLCFYAPSIIKIDKHTVSNVISPDANQSADAYIIKYRKYGLSDVYDNKVKGVYMHHKEAVTPPAGG